MTAPLDDVVMRPMSGDGIVARFGGVFLVVGASPAGGDEPAGDSSDSGDSGDSVVAQLVDICRTVASSRADGRVLVRRLAGLVASSDADPPAFAAIAPHGDDLIVFVHGDAEATVRIRGGEQRISGRESVAWVDRLVAWPADELVVTVPGARAAPAQGLLDLRGGIVPGAGFCVGVMSVAPSSAGSGVSEASQPLEPLPVLDNVAELEPPAPAVPPAPAQPATPAEPAQPPAPPPPAPPERDDEEPAPETAELTQQAPAAPPPTFEAVLLVGPKAPDGLPAHGVPASEGPTGPLPLAAELPTQSLVSIDLEPTARAVLVGGIYCSRGHFNDPDALYCGVCGIGMVQQTRHVVQGARPPLGVLVLDDGLTYVLDDDYVIGREPGYDEDVREGRALALAVEDPDGGISRAHAAVRLRDWEVIVCDKGSVNGTYVAPPGETVWTPLTPFQPMAIKPGTRVQVGRRTFVYDSHHHI